MTLVTIFTCVILLLALLCCIYLTLRLIRPLLEPIAALAGDNDSMANRVFPVLGFLGAAGILLKLTLF